MFGYCGESDVEESCQRRAHVCQWKEENPLAQLRLSYPKRISNGNSKRSEGKFFKEVA